MGQVSAQVPLSLLGPVLLNRFGFGGAILFPVAGMVGTPFPSTVAADLAILCIQDELLLAAMAAALLLAWLVRTGRLLRMKSGWLEQPFTVAATPHTHPFKVTDCPCVSVRNLDWEKKSPGFRVRSNLI